MIPRPRHGAPAAQTIGICLFQIWLAGSGAQALRAAEPEAALPPVDPLDLAGYMWARDREYVSYIEALDLPAETKDRLWQHLTRKHEAEADLDAQAQAEMGESYASEVDLLVITYDKESEHFQRRDALAGKLQEELHTILTDEQIEIHQRFMEVKDLERSRRKLRHEIEDMELGLSPVQFEVALEAFEDRPAFFQQAPAERGAAGYSTEYMQERERWRFDQEQDFLESRLIPILNDEQVKWFRKWQEAQRIELNRSLEMYKTSEEFMARLYPDRRRRVKLMSPAPLGGGPEKSPVYIECRDNQLFRIPVEEIRHRATETLKEIAERTQGTPRTLMQELAAARVETDAYRADLTYALLAQLALRAKRNAVGYELDDIHAERDTDWYGSLLASLHGEEEVLTFVVRDDSTEIFERARTLAEAKKLPYTYEVLDPVAPIKFALGGVPAIITDRPAEKRALGAPGGEGKTPTYIGVYRDRVVLYPDEDEVLALDLEKDGTPLDALLDDVEKRRKERYVVLLVHPRSAILVSHLRRLIGLRGIEVGLQLYEQGEELKQPAGG